MRGRCGAFGLLLAALLPLASAAQSRPRLDVQRADGSSTEVAVQLDRGYAVVRASVLADLGWKMVETDGGILVSAADEIAISMRLGSPFFRWDGVVLQLTDAPYRAGGVTFIPLQFLTDFLPRRLPGLYDFAGEASLLRAGDLSLLSDLLDAAAASSGAPAIEASSGNVAGVADAPPIEAAPAAGSEEEVTRAGPSSYDGLRVVVIDAGHGGEDPGALGPDGIREKVVALGIALRLEELLGARADLEVHMIRDDDTFVDLWERGQIATDLKGDRPGVFVSIHAASGRCVRSPAQAWPCTREFHCRRVWPIFFYFHSFHGPI